MDSSELSNYILKSNDLPSVHEVILKDMGKIDWQQSQHNTSKHKLYA